MNAAPFETFAALSSIPWIRHGFTLRAPQIAVQVQREQALGLLAESHLESVANIGLASRKLVTAEQVHWNTVRIIDSTNTAFIPDCDGLLTNDPNIALGIYTADCGAIYLVDTEHRALGLLHSGRKGTELGILSKAVAAMRQSFSTDPSKLIVQLAPCIRPPNYEIDFASEIATQALRLGIHNFHDCGKCTASNLEDYYSYRKELGKTGRHLAVLGYAD